MRIGGQISAHVNCVETHRHVMHPDSGVLPRSVDDVDLTADPGLGGVAYQDIDMAIAGSTAVTLAAASASGIVQRPVPAPMSTTVPPVEGWL